MQIVLTEDIYPSLSFSNFIIAVENEPYGRFRDVKMIRIGRSEEYTVPNPFSSVDIIYVKSGRVMKAMHLSNTLQIR
jgi:hypothetical protein